MALGPLAQFVSDLITQPFTTGLGFRKQFNADPLTVLGNEGITGDDLAAFLAFTKGEIGNQALDDLTSSDPDLAKPDNVRDFSIWLYDFARWSFDPTEDKEYDGVFPGGGIPAKYGNPKCQIRKVDPTATTAGPNGNKQVSLDVYGEGFLKTKSTLKIFDTKGNEQDSQTIDPIDKSSTEKSTFRGGLLRVTSVLAPGDYYALVHIDLGNTETFVIGDQTTGAFTVV